MCSSIGLAVKTAQVVFTVKLITKLLMLMCRLAAGSVPSYLNSLVGALIPLVCCVPQMIII